MTGSSSRRVDGPWRKCANKAYSKSALQHRNFIF